MRDCTGYLYRIFSLETFSTRILRKKLLDYNHYIHNYFWRDGGKILGYEKENI